MTNLLRYISITSTICDIHKIEVKLEKIVCMPINLMWNSYFLGFLREEYEAFSMGIDITLDRTPDSYAQETAGG